LEKEIYTKWDDTMWSALSYVINKKGAKQFLKHLIKNNKISLDLHSVTPHPADVYIYSKLKTYVYKYPFFVTVSKDTTIHEDHIHLKFHKKNKKRMTKLLKNI
jgi:hypothetical protein